MREWRGKLERVMVLEEGFAWNGKNFGSLSQIAKAMTGTSWNGHRFFGLRLRNKAARNKRRSSGPGDSPSATEDPAALGPVGVGDEDRRQKKLLAPTETSS